MLDLVVKNGKVYVDGSFRECDVGIKNGKLFSLVCPAPCQRHNAPLMRRASM